MKKRDFFASIALLSLSVVLFLTVWLTETKLEGMMTSGAAYCLVFGFMKLRKYLWWNREANRQMRDEILDAEEIEEQDERQVQLRDRAGRYTYLFSLYLLCAAALLCGILHDLEILAEGRTIAVWITLLLVFLRAAERILYKYLSKNF